MIDELRLSNEEEVELLLLEQPYHSYLLFSGQPIHVDVADTKGLYSRVAFTRLDPLSDFLLRIRYR